MKFVLQAVLYIVLMNAVLFLGSLLVGTEFEFNYILNLVTLVICALAATEVKQKQAKKAEQH